MRYQTVLSAVSALLLIMTGCSAENLPTSTSGPPDIPTVTQPGPDTATPEATATVSPLNPSGPWLLFAAQTGSNIAPFLLWATNPDGTGLRQITDENVSAFAIEPEPSGGQTRVAFVSSSDSKFKDITLRMLTLPDAHIQTITQLTSPESNSLPTLVPGDFRIDSSALGYDINASYAQHIDDRRLPDSLAWSPDGRWIAFLGAMDGLSVDVYSYEVATGVIRRLTTGADNAFQLSWSPDSQWIVHTAQGLAGRSGGIFEYTTGIWAATPDGSAVKQLEGPRPAEILGWLDADSLMVGAYLPQGPFYRNLRVIHISSGKIDDLAYRCDMHVAIHSGQNSYLAERVILDKSGDPCPDRETDHMALFLINNGQETRLPEESGEWIAGLDVFLLSRKDGSRVAISTDGSEIPSLAETLPPLKYFAASTDGSQWAWIDDDTVFIAPGPEHKPIALPGKYRNIRYMIAWVP